MPTYSKTGRQGSLVEFLHSAEDEGLIASHSWHVSGNGYVCNENREYLHRLVMKPSCNEVVDHIDGDKLNNSRSNLRLCSHADNIKNAKLSKRNTSGYKGVGWFKPSSKWYARIHSNGKQICLGYYSCKHEAAMVRLMAEEEHHGEYARK